MEKDYIYYLETTSLCPECLQRVPAKAVIRDNRLLLRKNCPQHGPQETLWEEDASWYLNRYQYDKPGTACATQTAVEKGCPFDCGLCPDHEQHTCIGLVEVTADCDLNCPVCYADSHRGGPHLPVQKIDEMLDFFVESEGGSAEILQISGGEPTTHPDILNIIASAMAKPIKYVMLNTNGLRIAEDPEFAGELAKFRGGFEVYLQYDGDDGRELRGRQVAEVKQEAIKRLLAHKIPITLVCTVENGLNDDRLGEVLSFAMNTPGIRGVNFQPLAYFGRRQHDAPSARATLTGVINRIEKQTNGLLKKSDFVPLPCNVERVALTFLYRKGKDFIPITRKMDVKDYLPLIRNTLEFDASDIQEIMSGKNGCGCSCLDFARDIAPLVPLKVLTMNKEDRMSYIDSNIFRITVTSFIDAYNFDLKSMRKECVHIITPDLKKVPFSAYNMIHRSR